MQCVVFDMDGVLFDSEKAGAVMLGNRRRRHPPYSGHPNRLPQLSGQQRRIRPAEVSGEIRGGFPL